MGDAFTGLREGFAKQLSILTGRYQDLIFELDVDEARRLGARAADAALAPLAWSAAFGERWPTSTVTEFLQVTRQALHKRILNGTILGLPGRGTTLFPTWQFDTDAHEIRPVVADIIRAFRGAVEVDTAFVIASWATTDQPELDMSPEEWLAAGKDPSEVARIARRSASRLVQ